MYDKDSAESVPDLQPVAMDLDFAPDDVDQARIEWLKARKGGLPS